MKFPWRAPLFVVAVIIFVLVGFTVLSVRSSRLIRTTPVPSPDSINKINLERAERIAGTKDWGWTRPAALSPDQRWLADVHSVKDERTNTYLSSITLSNLEGKPSRTFLINRSDPFSFTLPGISLLGWSLDGNKIFFSKGIEVYHGKPVVISDTKAGRDALLGTPETWPGVIGHEYVSSINVADGSIEYELSARRIYDYNPRTGIALVSGDAWFSTPTGGPLDLEEDKKWEEFLQERHSHDNDLLTVDLIGKKTLELTVPEDIKRGWILHAARTGFNDRYLAYITRESATNTKSRLYLFDRSKGTTRAVETARGEWGDPEKYYQVADRHLEIDYWYYDSVLRFFLIEDGNRIQMRQEPSDMRFSLGMPSCSEKRPNEWHWTVQGFDKWLRRSYPTITQNVDEYSLEDVCRADNRLALVFRSIEDPLDRYTRLGKEIVDEKVVIGIAEIASDDTLNAFNFLKFVATGFSTHPLSSGYCDIRFLTNDKFGYVCGYGGEGIGGSYINWYVFDLRRNVNTRVKQDFETDPEIFEPHDRSDVYNQELLRLFPTSTTE